ncbi:major facilitator superfamily domain-containing protein [Phascolomyces articulosus]|uniref:Major facilitator superfamily domain-containing protein n=1 Tax=Phascolomyces articulosus TaxID=60185 RepID=A0AAD5P878_9FUNG|nr:major facilitator superfamily domain-containing protein [Phascolomyces articulosus]
MTDATRIQNADAAIIQATVTENDSHENSTDNLEKELSSVKDTSVEIKKGSEPHCVFSKSKRMVICLIVSYSALISPLSGNSYYPALPQISQEFDVSISLANLSVTSYTIFQALSPSFWGPISDLVGRRPVYIATIVIFIGICVGLALAPSYSALLVLRMFQAFGSSSAIALGGGVITDISTPAERGGYIGIFMFCQTISMAVGPLVGGIISDKLSWRWLFWVLLMMGLIGLVLVFFFLPETLRSLVGNGSGYANPTPSQWFKHRKISNKNVTSFEPLTPTTRKIPNFLEPYLVLRNPDVTIIMMINGCFTYLPYCIMVTTPPHFSTIYGLSELQVGLCYICLGTGMIFGSFLSGRLLNRDYKVIALEQGIALDEIKKSGKLALDFPIYLARLRSCWVAMVLDVFVALGYGWVLYTKALLAVPVILQFLGATITGSSNIFRCMFGAIAASTIQLGIDRVGLGWMFTIIGLLLAIILSLIPILFKFGPIWRLRRSEKQSRHNTQGDTKV